MHEDLTPIRDTYDAYLDLATFSAYDNKLVEKVSFLELNMRKFKGYLEIYHAAKDNQIIVKFDSFKALRFGPTNEKVLPASKPPHIH